MQPLKLEGVFTALVTPFVKDGSKVDFDALEKLVEFQIEQGVNGLVPVGTTGECPTLSHDEHDEVIAAVTRFAAGRVPVIAGTGSNSTAEAIRLTQHAKKVGVDACLAVSPYYNKPTQEGLFQHFKAIADIGLPVVLYNIPGRCGVNMTPQTIARLAEHPSIIAVKEATGSLDQASEIASLCDITILSGDDGLTVPLMSIGGKGVISVLSNIAPRIMVSITDACLKGDYETARKIHLKNYSLFKTMFCETNPQPIKYALSLVKKCEATGRLPMVEMEENNKTKVEEALRQYELL